MKNVCLFIAQYLFVVAGFMLRKSGELCDWTACKCSGARGVKRQVIGFKKPAFNTPPQKPKERVVALAPVSLRSKNSPISPDDALAIKTVQVLWGMNERDAKAAVQRSSGRTVQEIVANVQKEFAK